MLSESQHPFMSHNQLDRDVCWPESRCCDDIIDDIYRVKVKVTVKPYVNSQYRSCTVLGDIRINRFSMDQFIKAIYDFVLGHAVGLAVPANSNGFRATFSNRPPL